MKFIIVVLITLCSARFLAQQYSFINYSVEEGLAQTQVFDITADEDGKIWIGTAGGVSCFDGRTFKNYSTQNGLIDNTVKNILSNNNAVWLASQYGITRIKDKDITSWDLSDLAKGRGISSFTFDKKNNLWLVIPSKGVYKIATQKNRLELEEITHFSLTTKNNLKTIYCDSKGLVWTGGRNVIGYFKGDSWNKLSLEKENFYVTSLVENSAKEVIVSTRYNGLFNCKRSCFTSIPLSENFGMINHLYFDSKNRLWVSTNEGEYIVNESNLIHLNVENGLVTNNVRTIAEDREGDIWIGTDGGGIQRFTSEEFVTFSKQDGLSSNYVLSIFEGKENEIYFSTYNGGVSVYDKQKFNVINKDKGLGDNTVWTSLAFNDSSYWFGTANGITTYNGLQLNSFRNKHWLTSNKVLSFFKEDESIWIGTSKGISCIRNFNLIESYKYQDNFPAKNIRTIEKGFNDDILVGTSSGIFSIKNKSVTKFRENDELQNEIVYSLKKINDSLLFIGTADGLYYYNKDSLTRVVLHESYSAGNINFIGVESDEYVWIGTNYGVFEINMSLFFKGNQNAIHHFTRTNGFPSLETNLNAFYKDSKNNIWMGTSRGVVRFNRVQNKRSQPVPIVKLDKVQLFLKETNWEDYSENIDVETKLPIDLSVGYKKNYFTFFYNAVAIQQNNELKYSVFLDGFDQEWSPPVDQKSVTYTNLPYGNYVFKVKATKDGLTWSQIQTFSFEIQKPFFLTLWFFALILISVVLLIFFIIKRQQKLNKQKSLTQKLFYKSKLQALEQQTLNASMNRHFIFNSLNSIQYYINTKDSLSANKYLTNFAKLIRKNLDSSVSKDNLVTLSDELERLELYLSLENMRFQDRFSYAIKVEESIDVDQIKVPPMFLQPYVENSIWHGILPLKQKGLIKVSLTLNSSGWVLITIDDNGLGIDKSLANKIESDHTSKGMEITSGRLALLKKTTNQGYKLKGPFQLEDKSGVVLGTRVEIELEV